MPTLPTNPHSIGDSGHVNDHNTIVTALSVVGVDLVASKTFATSSSVSVDNCFSTSYANYRIVFDITAASATTSLNLRWRVGGADSAGAIYAYGGSYVGINVAAGPGQTTYAASGTSWILTGSTVNSTTDPMAGTIDVYGPYETRKTRANGNYVNCQANKYSMTEGHYHDTATSYTGFTMYPGTGTITGTIRVYGLRN